LDYFDNKTAAVVLDVEDDLEYRIKYWEKLEALKSILTTEYLPEAIYHEQYILDNLYTIKNHGEMLWSFLTKTCVFLKLFLKNIEML